VSPSHHRLRRLLGRAGVLAAILALGVVAAASATGRGFDDRPSRILYATTDQNTLIKFDARSPERLKDIRAITGLPGGVKLGGIDFRPATGDLYGVGSDSVVYRVNPRTGIAVAEGPAFTPGLTGRFLGVDFNPTVDKIRVVNEAGQNLRLNVDEGTLLSSDAALNPGIPRIVGAGYTNSSFSAIKPTATQLYVIDSASDTISLQNPPNNGTLTNTLPLGIDVADQAGFDIAGDDNVGFLATKMKRGSGLYTVDPATGNTRWLGNIGGGRRLVVTGLAAWQD
jgi:DNA-binding beta-propeller fold protein YncE